MTFAAHTNRGPPKVRGQVPPTWLVVRQFIEIMTNTSSKDVHWLTYEEAESIEERPPSIAEWVASSCGAMTKSEKDTMLKITVDIAYPKNVSRQDRNVGLPFRPDICRSQREVGDKSNV